MYYKLWPIAATAGKIENDKFISLNRQESLRICKEYCIKKEELTKKDIGNYFYDTLNDISDDSTCQEQCNMVFGENIKENYINNCFKYTRPFFIFIILLFLLYIIINL